jgi:hypothetical protein
MSFSDVILNYQKPSEKWLFVYALERTFIDKMTDYIIFCLKLIFTQAASGVNPMKKKLFFESEERI